MDFSGFGGFNGKTIEDHVCEVIVVDFKSKKAIFKCEAVNGEIKKEDQETLSKAIESLKDTRPLKKTA